MKYNAKLIPYQFGLLLTILITFILVSCVNFLEVYSQEEDNEDNNSENKDTIKQEQRGDKTFYFPETDAESDE